MRCRLFFGSEATPRQLQNELVLMNGCVLDAPWRPFESSGLGGKRSPPVGKIEPTCESPKLQSWKTADRGFANKRDNQDSFLTVGCYLYEVCLPEVENATDCD